MPGKDSASLSGKSLVLKVKDLAQDLGLVVRTEVKVGRRLWGAVRHIDVVVTDAATHKTLGIECKYQGISGTAEEKIPAIIQDIAAWPIPGIVVFAGSGFSQNMRYFLTSTGKAVEFEDLKDWLCLYFGVTASSTTKEH